MRGSQLGRVLAAEGKSDEAAAILSPRKVAAARSPRCVGAGHCLREGWQLLRPPNSNFALPSQGLPQDAEAHFALGSVLMQEKKYPESQEELLLAARLKPELAEIYGNLAVVAAANKNYHLAIRALDERAKYLPEAPATYFLRATSLRQLESHS